MDWKQKIHESKSKSKSDIRYQSEVRSQKSVTNFEYVQLKRPNTGSQI